MVSEYSREQAIMDGVNVGEDIFLIETEVGKNGAHLMKQSIECLIFMRDVRSKNYFEQMKGRGTRVLSKAELQDISPSATENNVSPKLKAFLDLEQMVKPAPELDYEKELEEARDEKLCQ